MATGKFIYLAHPDLLNYTGEDRIYERYMRNLCEEAKRLSVPLEINLLGAEENRNYPDARFWRIAGEVGNTVILGSDAHNPADVYRKEALEKADKIIKANQLKVIETLEL